MDWKRIKAEYIAGGTSYRKLAEKYGVSFTTLTRTAQRENWVGLRKQAEDKATTKIVDVVTNNAVDKATNIIDVADKLLKKIEDIIDNVDFPTGIKDISTALKNIKDIKGFKSDADMREQEARIRNLERQAEADNASKDIEVQIGSEAEEYSR